MFRLCMQKTKCKVWANTSVSPPVFHAIRHSFECMSALLFDLFILSNKIGFIKHFNELSEI